jgi:hypothetical protein
MPTKHKGRKTHENRCASYRSTNRRHTNKVRKLERRLTEQLRVSLKRGYRELPITPKNIDWAHADGVHGEVPNLTLRIPFNAAAYNNLIQREVAKVRR